MNMTFQNESKQTGKDPLKFRYLLKLRNLIKEGIQQVSYTFSQYEREFPFELMQPGEEDDMMKQYEDFFQKVEHIYKEYKKVKSDMGVEISIRKLKNGG